MQKDSIIGHVFVTADSLYSAGECDGWLAVNKGPFTGKPEKAGSSGAEKSPEKGETQKSELKVNIHYITSDVMPLDRYKELADVRTFSFFSFLFFSPGP